MSANDTAALWAHANKLWFEEGRSLDALADYETLASVDPTDPVAQYQLARVLWALGRFTQANQALQKALRNRDALNAYGRHLVDEAAEQMGTGKGFAAPVPGDLAPDLLTLQAASLSPDQWLDVAYAARERAIWGLALQALRSVALPMRIIELDEDEREVRRRARAEQAQLAAMRDEMAASGQENLEPAEIVPPAASLTEAVTPALPRREPGATFQTTPLAVLAAILPEWSSVNEPLVMSVKLLNTSEETLVVNKRLLLNRPSAPPGYGEVSFQVEGPPGYFNLTQFQVRAGRPGPDDFGLLRPGMSVVRAYELLKYESLHLPGTYRIWATYRNLVASTVAGLAAFIGAVSSPAVEFTRLKGGET